MPLRLHSGVLAGTVVVSALAALPVMTAPAAAPRWTTGVEHRAEWVSGGRDGTTVVWGGWQPGWATAIDGASGEVLWKYRSRGDRVREASVSAAGIVLVDSYVIKPQTELTNNFMVMLDRRGRQLWKRWVPGSARLSPAGGHILSYDPENGVGLSVFRASDGGLLWRVPPERTRQIDRALFTADSRSILLYGTGSVSLFSVTGQLRWSLDFGREVVAAATSADGMLAAVLTAGRTADVTLVDQRHPAIAGVQLARFAEFAPPVLEDGLWDSAVVLGEGSAVVVKGTMPGAFVLKSFDSTARRIWEVALPRPPGSSGYLATAGTRLVALAVTTAGGITFHFIDGAGVGRQTLPVQAHGVPHWCLGAGGGPLAAILDGRLALYEVPVGLTSRPPQPGPAVAMYPPRERWGWVPLRTSLKPGNWRIRYDGAKGTMSVSSRDGRRTLRLELGRRAAVVNGTQLPLPAAPRQLAGQVQVPSTLLARFAAAAKSGNSGPRAASHGKE